MSDKRAPRRFLDDWMELVTECRQSGLTDAAWCEAQGISPSCFYNAVSRLRKKSLPDTSSDWQSQFNTTDVIESKGVYNGWYYVKKTASDRKRNRRAE